MAVINVTKLELNSDAFRRILHTDQVNSAIRSAGKLIGSTAKLKTQTHVVRSSGFSDHRQIGFVGGSYRGKTQAQVDKQKQKLANAVKRRSV